MFDDGLGICTEDLLRDNGAPGRVQATVLVLRHSWAGIKFSIAGAVYEDALASVDGLPEPRENRVIGVCRTVEYETSPAGARRILSALDRAAGDGSLSYYRRSTVRKHARILRGLLADDQR